MDMTTVNEITTSEKENVFTFGKYKGKPIDMLTYDSKYAKWLAETMDQKYMSSTLRDWLKQNGYKVKEPEIVCKKQDKRIITFGKYKNQTYDTIPDDYLLFILKSVKNGGVNGLYKCEDVELIQYAHDRLGI